jgi:clan AA aspartic protease (TIGR02281 family)
MRAFLVFVLVIGLGGSFATQFLSRSVSSAPQHGVILTSGSEDAERIAELKARNTPQFSNQDGTLEIDRSSDGQFYADVRINGSPVRMMIDTGASTIALSRDDARMAGLATSIGMNDVVGEGADGAVRGEYVKLDRVELGPLSAEGLDAIVLNSGGQSLLGQSFLSKFGSVHIEGDKMILR